MDSRRESELLARVPRELFIGGQWRAADDGATLDVFDPATEKVLVAVADASAIDAAHALDAAEEAQAPWAATPPRERGELLRAAWEALQQRADDFALLMTLEMGKPLDDSLAEVRYGSEFLRWFSEEAVRITGRYGLNPEGTGRMIVSRHPVGPSFLITPWNFPLAMATRKIAPALAAGCCVVVKPAAATPLTTLAFARLLEEVGLPPGVVNIVTSSSPSPVSETLLADSRLRKLSFTGSTEVGRALLSRTGQRMLRVSLELGGNAPFIVFDDADLDAAVDGAMLAKFRNIGQACTAANRFLVHASVHDEFAARLTERVNALRLGRGTEPGVTVGPLINEEAVSKLQRLVDDAIHRGANLRVGGQRVQREGTFFHPTVLTDVAPESAILAEEIFGPVVALTSFADEDEAVRVANSTDYGLVSYVYTRDLARGHRMIDRIKTGMTGLNVGVVSNAAAPFGGVKQSGIGREGGFEGIHEYLDIKYTLLPAD